MSKNNVWLQPGTRAHMLVYRPDTRSWQLWTATDKRSGNSDTWYGTYLEVFDDGRCIQHNRHPSDVREIEIRPSPEYEYVCVNGHDRCYLGPTSDCLYCEQREKER